MLQELFEPESAQAILSIPIPLSPKPCELIWVKDSKGVFSVKSTYRVEQEDTSNSLSLSVPWQKIWSLKPHERVKMLLWRIGSNSLPTKESLMLRLGSNDNLCPLCESAVKTCTHLFFKCPIARPIWFASR